MAINYKERFLELTSKEAQPLTEVELGYVQLVENHIDRIIDKEISTDIRQVSIPMAYCFFNTRPDNKAFPIMTTNRKNFLTRELYSRYKEANWEISEEYADSRSSFGGLDYIIFKGIL